VEEDLQRQVTLMVNIAVLRSRPNREMMACTAAFPVELDLNKFIFWEGTNQTTITLHITEADQLAGQACLY
jgi:hypothetical protein